MTTNEERDRWFAATRHLLAESSPERPWYFGDLTRTDPPIATREEMIARVAEALGRRDDASAWCVFFRGDSVGDLLVCLTGNGPKSEANARFIAHAPVMVATLLDEVAMLEARVAAAESRGRAEGAAEERRRADRDAVLGRAVRAALGEDGARTISYAISAVGDTRTRSIVKRRGSVAGVMAVLSCNDAIAALTAIGEAVQADAERGAHEPKEKA